MSWPLMNNGRKLIWIRKLETLLDSRIATTSKLDSLHQVVRRPAEKIWKYDKLLPSFATELYKLLKDQFGDLVCLEGVFRFAWTASSELGKWCADRAWTHALAEEVLPRLEVSVSNILHSESDNQVPDHIYEEVARIKEASDLVRVHTFNDPNVPGELSCKVQVLLSEVSKYFGGPTDTKCIVFTKQRYTAIILNELFKNLNIPHLRSGVIVGVRSGDIAGMNVTFQQQLLALTKFRKGEINCLVSSNNTLVLCVLAQF